MYKRLMRFSEDTQNVLISTALAFAVLFVLILIVAADDGIAPTHTPTGISTTSTTPNPSSNRN